MSRSRDYLPDGFVPPIYRLAYLGGWTLLAGSIIPIALVAMTLVNNPFLADLGLYGAGIVAWYYFIKSVVLELNVRQQTKKFIREVEQ